MPVPRLYRQHPGLAEPQAGYPQEAAVGQRHAIFQGDVKICKTTLYRRGREGCAEEREGIVPPRSTSIKPRTDRHKALRAEWHCRLRVLRAVSASSAIMPVVFDGARTIRGRL